MIRHLFFCIFFSCLGGTLLAQQALVSLQTDKRQIYLGEQIRVDIRLQPGSNDTNGQWFDLPDSVNHLEVLDKSKIDTSMESGKMEYRQHFYVTGFDSGRWVFPSLRLQMGGQTIATDSFEVDVMPVDVSKMKDYHDIKEIMDVPGADKWKYILPIALATLLALTLLIYYLRKRWATMEVKKTLANIGNKNPYEWAMEELAKLKKNPPTDEATTKAAYSQADLIYRTYVFNRFGMRALQQTSHEAVQALRKTKLVSDDVAQYADTVRLIDVVKFAKFVPGAEEFPKNLGVIQTVIEKFEKSS